ncbi:MAG TPA: DUF488 domain-containing protein [Chitinophagaceae bacterium]|nr:DUF488 domain-containing protein [Chitinophagaceae bacterium]HMZ46106.1 DUF488 domain-containing protein [Chitinophagaceae bacterium]HNE94062.1 DUF488 domain-containing protein [Chitinophagaceae bacterium]HNJ58295.1 DUF488 domain-containing protein [Chitinophagaceae bacterium]HNM34234.1 DUF488 domain-containing protein [Chitinophagaceae bacterium]
MIVIKRIYEHPSSKDGYRVLVDRLWPRGVSKQAAKIDLWCKEIAPSPELRKWFAHDEKKWIGFKNKYTLELEQNIEQAEKLKTLEKENKHITLLYAAKNPLCNHALVLNDFLSKL